MKKRMSLFVSLLLMLTPALGSWAAEPDLKAILRSVDEMSNFDAADFSATYTMVSEKPGEETSVFTFRMFRRDRSDLFLLLFLEPEIQKGQGYLQLEDNLWFYDPESRKFSHSSLKENLQDSETKNSDFRRSSLSEDYQVESYSEETLGKHPVYVIDLAAGNQEVPYPRLKLWIHREQPLVLKVENYSLSRRLMRTAYYPKYVKVGQRYIPSRMLFVDELKEGEKTQVTIRDASVAAVPDSVFTKAYLERVNR